MGVDVGVLVLVIVLVGMVLSVGFMHLSHPFQLCGPAGKQSITKNDDRKIIFSCYNLLIKVTYRQIVIMMSN